jgi:hypothetical protein
MAWALLCAASILPVEVREIVRLPVALSTKIPKRFGTKGKFRLGAALLCFKLAAQNQQNFRKIKLDKGF